MAIRSMWSGSVSFGLVNVPVKLYKATESYRAVGLCHVHSVCNTAVREKKYCPKCEVDIIPSEMKKAFAEDSKKKVCFPLEQEEIDSLPVPSARTMQVVGTIPSLPDIRYIDGFYVIEPDEGGGRAFALLETVLRQKGIMAVTKISMASRERLAVLQPTGDGLLGVITLQWASGIRDLSELKRPEVELQEKELQMAEMLIDNLPQEIDLADFQDEYSEALKELVEKKKAGNPITTETEEVPLTVDENLLDLLMASFQESKLFVNKQ